MRQPAERWGHRFPLPHLVRRFFAFLGAQPLTPAEQEEIAALLEAGERGVFYAQASADQRHAYDTMRRAGRRQATATMLRAALLHDIGKAHTRIGAIGRSLATVLAALRLPLWPAAATYRRHGEIGAETLAELGVEALVVDFARRHPSPDPGPHDPGEWRALLEADHL